MPPNVLVIMTDDQGPWAMGCAGTPELDTPTLDRIAAEGMRFSNFFCASPVCSPARATFLTGRMPSAHGVHDWLKVTWCGRDRPREYLDGLKGFTDHLAAPGSGRLAAPGCRQGADRLRGPPQPRPARVRALPGARVAAAAPALGSQSGRYR